MFAEKMKHAYPDSGFPGWFTVEKIDNTTFAISEYKHWEETHSYLLIGAREALLIDTGMGIADISGVVRSLTDKPVTAIATHVHYDHVGGHWQYRDSFFVHPAELDWITGSFPLTNEQIVGFLTEQPCEFPMGFAPEKYRMFSGPPKKLVRDGDFIGPSDRPIQVLHTPGHSPGHMCFYDPEHRYLFTGDLIYWGEFFLYYPSTDPVAYRESVKRLAPLSVERLLPAHHGLAITPEIIPEVEAAFDSLAARNLLKHGAGRFTYGKFSMHI
ncbi:MAG: MBL fold metallo-hydrolase [Victivallaceae bacterium]|nr:MBL fold metallo-hydrolase [Victivallaceae bacterium]